MTNKAEQKNRRPFLQSFLVKLGENVFEFYSALIGIFFVDGKVKQIKF